MGNFSQKVDKFIEIFLDQNGYVKVLQGLQNTLMIAICGLIIGIVIGTLIATVRVIPKYKTLPKVLNHICSFYVALFRGTPMVVQLLVFYYVLLPIIGVKITGVKVVAMVVFGLNSGAFISLVKETSVVSFVGAADLYVAFNYIGSNSYEFMVPYLVMALIYIALVLIITLLVKILERSLKKSDRRN